MGNKIHIELIASGAGTPSESFPFVSGAEISDQTISKSATWACNSAVFMRKSEKLILRSSRFVKMKPRDLPESISEC